METKKGRIVKRKLRIVPKLCDIDMVGVVYNANHFKWFDEGRFSIISETISLNEIIESGITFMIAENHCVYKNYAIYGEPLILYTTHRINEIYQGRFGFEHIIIHEKKKTEIACGSSSMVVVNYRTKQLLKELPDFMWSRYIKIT